MLLLHHARTIHAEGVAPSWPFRTARLQRAPHLYRSMRGWKRVAGVAPTAVALAKRCSTVELHPHDGLGRTCTFVYWVWTRYPCCWTTSPFDCPARIRTSICRVRAGCPTVERRGKGNAGFRGWSYDDRPVDVVLLYDLTTRDGRQAIEVRGVSKRGSLYRILRRKTVYSVAYDTQLARIVAFGRAFEFCEANALNLLAYECGRGGSAVQL